MLRHLSELGLGVNWEKSKLSPVQRISFLGCGVRFGEYDGTPHGRACPSSAELPEFLQRQECGTTETVSEAPGAYGICHVFCICVFFHGKVSLMVNPCLLFDRALCQVLLAALPTPR